MVMIGKNARLRSGATVLPFGAPALACGAAAVIALTGCSSGGSGGSGSSGSGGGGSAKSGSAPSWAAVLGPGVTVTEPATAPEGNDSPGSVMTDVADALNKKDLTLLCKAMPPSRQPQCQSEAKGLTQSQLNAEVGTISNFKIGYIVVHGTQAIGGDTGKECNPDTKSCFSNSDPAAIFDTNKKPFASLWKTVTTATNGATEYTLTPMTEISGKWYLYAPPSSSSATP